MDLLLGLDLVEAASYFAPKSDKDIARNGFAMQKFLVELQDSVTSIEKVRIEQQKIVKYKSTYKKFIVRWSGVYAWNQ